MQINSASDFRKALENGPYAWPGGYPCFFIASDGAALSFEAAQENKFDILHSIANNLNDGWRVIGFDINYEDANLYCEHTGKRIESAYAEETA